MSLPFVSVVMPIRNEGRFIARSLGRILAQDYPQDRYEIIVADGMSDDDTREQIAALAPGRERLHVIDNAGGIVATGLNAAIRRATGEVIVRVDGHTEIETDYVRECVDALARTGADNVGGRMDAVGDGPFGEAVAIATSSPFGVGGARFHYSTREEWVDTVYMGAWKREVFGRIGLFDEELVRDQDDEFNYRLRKSGGRILLTPRIRSRYTVRGSPSRLWRQYLQYGYWKVRVLQKHAHQMQPRQFVPPAFAAALVGLALAAFWLRPAAYGLAGLVGAYASVNFVATLVAGWRWPRLLARIALAFGIVHLAYGTGFLAGLARFARRWGTGASPLVPAADD